MNTPSNQIPQAPQEPKPAVQSVGMVGNSVSLVSIIVAIIAAKTHLPPDAVNEIVAPLVVSAVGVLAGLWGRIRAKGPITSVTPPAK